MIVFTSWILSHTHRRSSMLGGLFGSVCSIDITFDAEQNRKTAALGGAGPGVPVIRQVISAWCFHVMFHTDQSSQL